jgi:hypothetical protein
MIEKRMRDWPTAKEQLDQLADILRQAYGVDRQPKFDALLRKIDAGGGVARPR